MRATGATASNAVHGGEHWCWSGPTTVNPVGVTVPEPPELPANAQLKASNCACAGAAKHRQAIHRCNCRKVLRPARLLLARFMPSCSDGPRSVLVLLGDLRCATGCQLPQVSPRTPYGVASFSPLPAE